MADTFTPNLNLDKPPVSAYDVFGAKMNANLDKIDAAAGSGGMFPPLAADPVSPYPGQAWLNTTQNQFKAYNGVTVVVLG
jgi:hypothetical protein